MPESLYRPKPEYPSEELRSLKPKDRVRVRDDSGNEADYEVKYEPWQLGHGEWVVGLKGMAGSYMLSRVVKVLSRGGDARVDALEAEIRILQQACEDHIRIRNEQGERFAELVKRLRSIVESAESGV